MSPSKKLHWVLVTAAAVLASCGFDSSSDIEIDAIPEGVDSDAMTLELFTTGGDTNFITVPLNSFPELAIDTSGVAWKRVEDSDHDAAIPALRAKQLSSLTRQRIVGRLASIDPLFEPDSDFGSTKYNDQLNTSLTVTVDGKRQALSVYDIFNETTNGDQDLRDDLSDVIADALDVIDADPALWGPAITESILVLTEPTSDNYASARDWPTGIAEPEHAVDPDDERSGGYGCDAYTDDDRDALLEQAAEATRTDVWNLTDGPHHVLVRPVFFEPDCERALAYK